MEFYREILEKVLAEKKFTKSKLARLIGVTQPAVGAWIRGQRVPRERNVAMMAKALDIPVDEISNLKKVADISEEVSGYFQGWGSSLNKNKTELEDPCIKAIKEIESIKSEQYRLRTVTRAFMSTMQSMLYVKSYYGKYIVANESYLKAIGLDVNINIIGKTDKDIMSMKVAATNDTQDMSIINTGKPLINKSVKFPFPNSKIKWCIMTKVPLRDNDQNIVGMVASFADITEERKLRRQDEILNGAIRQCNVGISVISIVSGKRKIEFLNEAAEKIFGYGREEIKKDPLCWRKNVKDSDKYKIDEYLSDIMKPERSVSFFYINPLTGKEMYLWFESYRVKDSNLFYNCVYDETEFLKNEQEKEKLFKERELLNEVVKQSNMAVGVTSVVSGKRKYIYSNDAMNDILGYCTEDFAKDISCWHSNIKKSDRQKVDEFLVADMQKKNVSFYYIDPKSGREKYLTIKTSEVKGSSYKYNCIFDDTEKREKELEQKKLFTGFNLLIDFLDKTGSAVFVGEYRDTTLDLVNYVYRNKKTYNYIGKNENWEDIVDPKQRDELFALANVKKYPKIMKYNIIKNSEICTIEEKLWLKEVDGKKFFFSVIRDIERQDNVEVVYTDSLEL